MDKELDKELEDGMDSWQSGKSVFERMEGMPFGL
jgi:hypothetical protein